MKVIFGVILLVFFTAPVWGKKAQNCKKVFKKSCGHNLHMDCLKINMHNLSVKCQDFFILNSKLKGNEQGCRYKYNQICEKPSRGKRLRMKSCLIANKKKFSGRCIRALINEKKQMNKLVKNCEVVFTKLCPFKPRPGDKVDLKKIGLDYAKCMERNKNNIPKNCTSSLDSLSESYTPIEDRPTR